MKGSARGAFAGPPLLGIADMDALARRPADGKGKSGNIDVGSVAEFVELVNSTVGKHFKCCICFSILENPVMLPCNHSLCRGCAAQSLRQFQRCPQCLANIPNLRTLQGRNKWVTEMVDSLRNCLNEVGVSLTQHAPVPSIYRNARPPAPLGRARSRASHGTRAPPPSPPAPVRCQGSSCGEANRKGRGNTAKRKRAQCARSPSPAAAPARRPPSRGGHGSVADRASSGSRSPLLQPGGAGPDLLWGDSAQHQTRDQERTRPLPRPPSLSDVSVHPAPVPPPPQPFVLGDLVFVDHRTWPGMNKYGGVALVCGVLDPPGSSYDVKYSVSRKLDRGVEARYVHPYCFPAEPVGSRSRRGGDGCASYGTGGGGSSGRSGGRGSISPRRSPSSIAPAISPALVTGGVAVIADFASAPSPLPFPSQDAGDHGQAKEGPENEQTVSSPVSGEVRPRGGLPHETHAPRSGGEVYDFDATMSIGNGGGRDKRELSGSGNRGSDGSSDRGDTEAARKREGQTREGRAGGGSASGAPRSDQVGEEKDEEKEDKEEEDRMKPGGKAPRVSGISGNTELEACVGEVSTAESTLSGTQHNLPWCPMGPDARNGAGRRRREPVRLSGGEESGPRGALGGGSTTSASARLEEDDGLEIVDDDTPLSISLRTPEVGARRHSLAAGPDKPSQPDSASPPRDPSAHSNSGRFDPVICDTSAARARASGSTENDPRARFKRQKSSMEIVNGDIYAGSPRSPSFRISPARPAEVLTVSQRTPRQVMPPPPSATLRSPTVRPHTESSPTPPPSPLDARSYKVGDLVDVPSRSSPGVNKEGGVARVTRVGPGETYDVKYLVRQGSEKGLKGTMLTLYALPGSGGGSDGGGRDKGRHDVAASRTGVPVRRTYRTNKGSCPPDAAAGQANAACLSYLLGETQHPELELDPDLGEELDPNEHIAEGSRMRLQSAAILAETGKNVAVSAFMTDGRGGGRGRGRGRGRGGRGSSGKRTGGSEGRVASLGGGVGSEHNGGEGGDWGSKQPGASRAARRHARRDDAIDAADGSRSERDKVVRTTMVDSTNRGGGGSGGVRLRVRGSSAPAAIKRGGSPGKVSVARADVSDKGGSGVGGSGTATRAKSGRDGGVDGMPTVARRGKTAAVVFTMSGVTVEMTTLAESLEKSHGWRVKPKYTHEVTHVVCGAAPGTNKANIRSAKFLRAVASGKWIVGEAWLQECKLRGKHVPEESFEILGDRKSAVPSAPRRSRLAHAESDRRGLFHGTTFHFRGEFGRQSPPLSELEPMLLDNGGTIVETLGSLFVPQGVGGKNAPGAGGSGSNSSSGGWRPQRVVIFQPCAASAQKDALVLARELATFAELEPSPALESGGGVGGRGVGDAVEVVKPLWLVDSVGSFRVLKPTVLHRVELPDVGDIAIEL